jgi:hypothetical protein
MQALLLRVQTTFGSDRFNTTYGLDVTNAFTQPGTVSEVKSLIKLSLVRTLGTDPRLQCRPNADKHITQDPGSCGGRRRRAVEADGGYVLL